MSGWKVWSKGIAAAVIGGSASALTVALAAPQLFTLSRASVLALLRVSAVAAVLNAAAYLKKSPLPTECEGGK